MTNSSKNIRIDDIEILLRPNCKIKNKENVEKLINELIFGGLKKLQIVSDFDQTITKQKLTNGDQVLTSFGIFNSCKSLSPIFKEETRKLFEKFHPIEIDPEIPIDVKVQNMIEWWTKSSELLTGFPFDLTEIDEQAYKHRHALRDRTHDFFETLNKLNVPVLVFSAGLGNVVHSVLKQANVLYPNVKIVSNFLQYKNGLLNGLQEKLIHTFNKNETALEGTEYYDLVHDRDHIIVLGDSIGDAQMANGVPTTSNVLKIGFLFNHIAGNLEKYMDTFDIVLIDDQTMDVPIALLSLIVENSQ